MSISDEVLLEKCRQGDSWAWDQLVEKYKRLIFSIPLNFGLNADEAADIAQQTLMTLVDHLDRLRADSHLGGWMATVARRYTLHYLRKRKRERVGDVHDIAEDAAFEVLMDIQMDGAHWEMLEMVNEGLQQLDVRCRELLLALYFDANEVSYEEVAERLQLRVGSIGPIRGRCLARLKKILQA